MTPCMPRTRNFGRKKCGKSEMASIQENMPKVGVGPWVLG
jgi:hypothetical protein